MIVPSVLARRFSGLQIKDRASFWQLTGILFLVYFSTGIWSPLLSVYIGSLGAGTRDIGVVLATFQVTSLLSQSWWGAWSDRLARRKPLLLLGTAGLALSYLGIALSPEWVWIIPFRMLEGLSLAAYSTGSLALVGDLLEDQGGRGRLMGLYRTFGSLAFSLAAISGGVLADRFGIRVPLLLAAGFYTSALGLSLRVKDRSDAVPIASRSQPAQDHGDAPRLPPGVTRGAVWAFLGMVFLWMFGMGSIVSFWPVYMQSVGYSKTAVGSLWGLAAMGEVPGLLLAGYLADRWGRKRVLITGMSLMAGVFLGYTVSTALLWLVAIQLVRSLAYSSYEAPALLYATELGLRHQRGRLASLFYAAGGVGSIAGSLLGGAIAREVGLVIMYRGVVAFMVLGILVAGSWLPRSHRATVEAP
ncbi:MAG TPA: MFS transporter [Herpetosiphonaceae bacterium]|nr:MFS transporter [Herpetosiphonaceae bacterium]